MAYEEDRIAQVNGKMEVAVFVPALNICLLAHVFFKPTKSLWRTLVDRELRKRLVRQLSPLFAASPNRSTGWELHGC